MIAPRTARLADPPPHSYIMFREARERARLRSRVFARARRRTARDGTAMSSARRDSDCKPSSTPNGAGTAESADLELKVKACIYHHGGHARTPRDRVYVILNASLRNAALVHYHDRLRAMWRSPARRTCGVAVPIQCPCAPAEQDLSRKGGSARCEVGPARPAAHRSHSACCAEVQQ